MQNVHRYFLYLAVLFILILAYDIWKALWFVDPATGKHSFGIGVGTIVLAINVYLLGGYTFGCHSLRHLIGGFRRDGAFAFAVRGSPSGFSCDAVAEKPL